MSRVPRLLPGQDFASLSLTPTEAFLVSRIDATLSEHDLAFVTGMTPLQVEDSLDRLAMLGAIDFVEDRRPVGRAESAPPGGRMTGHDALDPGSPSPPLYDPAELDENVDLDQEKKRRILDLYYRLDDLTYYELLGLTDQADKKQVKSAYYALAPEFHPDKFFRKNLGSFKGKTEAIFGRFTLAHDVLANLKRRQEYDDYIATTHRNRAMSAMLEQAPRDVAAVRQAVEQAAAAALASAGPTVGRYEALGGSGAGAALSADEALRLRKEALARKLMGGGRRTSPIAPARTPAARPAEMDPEIAARAAEALRLRHEAALADAKRQQVLRYLEAGRQALERQDFAGAANAYRIAAALEPDDPRVQATCNEALKQAAVALADGYWKQAVYEESQERWSEAALSYSKVCAGRSEDALAHERVAYATLRSSTNVRRAVEFARKSVELSPKTPEFRVTLARAYLAAGLEKSCNGELDRALELAGANPKIQAMAAQVRASATTSPKDAKVS
jgi:curved DNA-binding protein CbpA